jgi:hypothetical protein
LENIAGESVRSHQGDVSNNILTFSKQDTPQNRKDTKKHHKVSLVVMGSRHDKSENGDMKINFWTTIVSWATDIVTLPCLVAKGSIQTMWLFVEPSSSRSCRCGCDWIMGMLINIVTTKIERCLALGGCGKSWNISHTTSWQRQVTTPLCLWYNSLHASSKRKTIFLLRSPSKTIAKWQSARYCDIWVRLLELGVYG